MKIENNVMHLSGEVKPLPPPFPPLPGFIQAKTSDSNDWPDLSTGDFRRRRRRGVDDLQL